MEKREDTNVEQAGQAGPSCGWADGAFGHEAEARRSGHRAAFLQDSGDLTQQSEMMGRGGAGHQIHCHRTLFDLSVAVDCKTQQHLT